MVHEHVLRERVITWHFIILINVPKVSSSFLGGIVLGKLPQLREALSTLREGRMLVCHCVEAGAAHTQSPTSTNNVPWHSPTG